MSGSLPPPYSTVVHEANAHAARYRQIKDWPSLLSLRLRFAARYPLLADPIVSLINDYVPVVIATQHALPLLVPLASQSADATPTVRADAALLDHLQARLMQRLEALAARRSIRIRICRQPRAVLEFTQYGPWIPWFGPPTQGHYVTCPVPHRVQTRGRAEPGRPLYQWQWPRHDILLSAGPTNWRPVALANFLVQVGVYTAHLRRRSSAIQHALSNGAPTASGRNWYAQLAEMRPVDRELGGPVDAVNRARASGRLMLGYSRLLGWLLRDEILRSTLTPPQEGE